MANSCVYSFFGIGQQPLRSSVNEGLGRPRARWSNPTRRIRGVAFSGDAGVDGAHLGGQSLLKVVPNGVERSARVWMALGIGVVFLAVL